MTAMPTVLSPIVDPFWRLIEAGGPVVVLLLVLSVLALAMALAKLMHFRAETASGGAGDKALALWRAGHRDEARRLLAGEATPEGEVLGALMAGASREGVDVALLREDIEQVCLARLSRLRRYLRPLDMIAQVAPMIGLFGTVLGMIEAFRAMQGAGATVDPSVLAGGIWVALLTTAVGLAIAIPVTAFVTWAEGRVEREGQRLEALVTAFFTGSPTTRDSATVVPLEAAKSGGPHAL